MWVLCKLSASLWSGKSITIIQSPGSRNPTHYASTLMKNPETPAIAAKVDSAIHKVLRVIVTYRPWRLASVYLLPSCCTHDMASIGRPAKPRAKQDQELQNALLLIAAAATDSSLHDVIPKTIQGDPRFGS